MTAVVYFILCIVLMVIFLIPFLIYSNDADSTETTTKSLTMLNQGILLLLGYLTIMFAVMINLEYK